MNTESRRGGCLDTLVQTFTLGKYGVETTIVEGVVPTMPSDLDNPNNATQKALRTGEPVLINNFLVEESHLARKIVKNK